MKRKRIIPVAVMLMAALVYTIWPPKSSPAQAIKKDSGIAVAVAVDQKADSNLERLQKLKDELPASRKPEKETLIRKVEKVIHHTVIKKVPVYVVDTVYKDTTIIRTIYKDPPRYSNGETQYQTRSEWMRDNPGKSEKGYRAYLKSLNLLR